MKNFLYFLLFKLSILKTIKFNFCYFGFRGLFVFPVLVGKYVELKELKGSIKIDKFSFGRVYIGINDMGHFPTNMHTVFQNFGDIICNGKVKLGIGTKISNHGILTFGNNFCITANSIILCYKSITFKDDILVSWNCEIMDSDSHFIYDENNLCLNPNEEIIIGEHCWICSGVKILKGVRISKNNIICANSIITKTIDKENAILANNRVLKENISWKL